MGNIRHRQFYPGKTLLILAFTIILASCAMQRAKDAEEAKNVMRGMTKEQVFACMGLPKRKGAQGALEIWSYNSGNDYRSKTKGSNTLSGNRKNKDDSITDMLGSTLSFSDEVSESRYCVVQILFQEERVKRVTYTGPTGGFLTDNEQCAFAVRNCLPE